MNSALENQLQGLIELLKTNLSATAVASNPMMQLAMNGKTLCKTHCYPVGPVVNAMAATSPTLIRSPVSTHEMVSGRNVGKLDFHPVLWFLPV